MRNEISSLGLGRIARHAFVIAVAVALALVARPPAFARDARVGNAQDVATISPQLESQLAAANEPVSFLVILDEQVDAQSYVAQFASTSEARGSVRAQRAEALYHALTERARVDQAPLRTLLDAAGVPYRSYYIVNMIEVRGDAALAHALRSVPGVNRLAANPLVRGDEPTMGEPEAAWIASWPAAGSYSAAMWVPGLYGLPYTHAPEVWDMGYTGQGIVVASQDTGVQWDHPALVERYRGWDAAAALADHPYNWFDAWDAPSSVDRCGPDYQIPCDDNGHGTHTVGTMVGDATDDPASSLTILGMAPGAKWIGCRNMRNNYGTPASYAACFEFMLAPYPQGGDPFTDGRPELAPHVINNSWICPPTEGCDVGSLRQIVETARAAGQLVVAAAGNDGPLCSTIQYPISVHDASFTVGAHDQLGRIASFSGRGPVTSDGSNRLKPEFVAPGVSVLSAIPYNNYGHMSGTSMSGPHAAGAAALVWSAAPDLIGDIDLTEQALIKSATPVDESQCLTGPPSSPNPVFGYGRLDVLAAVILSRTPWLVVITVVDEAGAPHVGLPVELVDDLTRYRYVTATNASGVARLTPVLSGSYSLQVGRGNTALVVPGIRLQPADDPDIGERRRRLQITYDFNPSPLPRVLYLPHLGR